MLDYLRHLLESGAVPFMLMTGETPKFSLVRMVETLIIAGITALVSYVLVVVVLQVKLEALTSKVVEMRNEQVTLNRDIRSDLTTIQIYAYTHVHEGKSR